MIDGLADCGEKTKRLDGSRKSTESVSRRRMQDGPVTVNEEIVVPFA